MQLGFLSLGHIEELLKHEPCQLEEAVGEAPEGSGVGEFELTVVLKHRQEDILERLCKERLAQFDLALRVEALLRIVVLEYLAEEANELLRRLVSAESALKVDVTPRKVLNHIALREVLGLREDYVFHEEWSNQALVIINGRQSVHKVHDDALAKEEVDIEKAMQCANKQLTQWLRRLIKLKLSKWLKVDNWRVREFSGASCQAVEL